MGSLQDKITVYWHLSHPVILLDGEAADLVQMGKLKFVDLRSSGQDSACLSDSKEGGRGRPHGSIISRYGQNAMRSEYHRGSIHVNLF